MAQSVLDICNMALDYCNTRNITSIDESTKEAKKCKAWYDVVRKSLLMNLNATFSIKRAVLSEYADYVPVYGYGKAYVLPRDLLQVLNLGNPIDDKYYQIEGQYFYCDESIENVQIRYIADITDVTKFDSEFCDCLALFDGYTLSRCYVLVNTLLRVFSLVITICEIYTRDVITRYYVLYNFTRKIKGSVVLLKRK